MPRWRNRIALLISNQSAGGSNPPRGILKENTMKIKNLPFLITNKKENIVKSKKEVKKTEKKIIEKKPNKEVKSVSVANEPPKKKRGRPRKNPVVPAEEKKKKYTKTQVETPYLDSLLNNYKPFENKKDEKDFYELCEKFFAKGFQ